MRNRIFRRLAPEPEVGDRHFRPNSPAELALVVAGPAFAGTAHTRFLALEPLHRRKLRRQEVDELFLAGAPGSAEKPVVVAAAFPVDQDEIAILLQPAKNAALVFLQLVPGQVVHQPGIDQQIELLAGFPLQGVRDYVFYGHAFLFGQMGGHGNRLLHEVDAFDLPPKFRQGHSIDAGTAPKIDSGAGFLARLMNQGNETRGFGMVPGQTLPPFASLVVPLKLGFLVHGMRSQDLVDNKADCTAPRPQAFARDVFDGFVF